MPARRPPLPPSVVEASERDPELGARLAEDFSRVVGAAEALGWAEDQLGALLSASSDSGLLAAMVEIARSLTDAPEVWAIRWEGDPGRGRTSLSAVAGGAEDIPAPHAVSRTVVAQVARSGRPAWSDDAAGDARFQEARSVHGMQLRSVGCVPIGSHGVLYLHDPENIGRFDLGVRLRLGALCRLAARVLDAQASAPVSSHQPLPGWVGDSAPARALAEAVRAFASVPWPVLVLGETGSGKEVVARALHALSPRKDEPFLALNCGAIVESLAESELFGHERGAFTGADRRQSGRLEQVGRGTLFLDEVGELSHALQVKLLRVLQEGRFRTVGGRQEQQFFGRIVAATHRALGPGGEHPFREDLYYRLAACVVRVPPLRDRLEDVPAIADHLVARAVGELPGTPVMALAPDARGWLRGQAWPGNVRELDNALRQAVARCMAEGHAAVEARHFGMGEPARRGSSGSVGGIPADLPLAEATERFQEQWIDRALEAEDGKKAAAARRLGVSRQWLHRLLARREEG